MTRSVAFKTLGCRLNQYETDALTAEFRHGGYNVVTFEQPADVYIINTCTVTGQSDQKSRQAINQAIRRGKEPVVVVTGCMANNHRDTLEKQEFITYVIENDQKTSIFQLVESHYNKEILHPIRQEANLFGYRAVDTSSRTRSFIKVQDGCDNFCTFCIIPFVRGRAQSRSVSSITENVKQVIDAGYNEFVLTGVNIGRYDDNGIKLGKLLEDIVAIPGDFRVRISSIEPDGFTDAFFSMLEHEKIMPHLHLCLQSGSERILRNMRRMYTAKQFMQMVEHVRARIPAFNFTTDVMVGFPDESAADFQNTLNICQQAAFSHIHTFKYSKRTGTRAERMDDQIPETIKKERSAIVRDLADRMKLDYMKQWPGQHEEMLVERIRDGRATGYGKHYLPLEADATGLSENQVIPVKIETVITGRDPKLHVSPAH